MAIYHLSVSVISRGSCSSASSRSDYINKEKNYAKNADEVLYKKSGNMPKWANENPKIYWSSADNYERANGRLFKQIIVAIPNELNSEEQKILIKKFTKKITSSKDGKLPYSFAIHKGLNGEQENVHAHIMISERAIDEHNRSPEIWFKRANKKEPEKGGAAKSISLMSKKWLYNTREEWANKANEALKKAGLAQRIDHRSLEAQGVTREPTRHRGVALNAMLRQDKIKISEIKKNLEINKNENLLKKELQEELDFKKFLTEGVQTSRNEEKTEKLELQKQIASKQREIKIQQQENLKRAKETQRLNDIKKAIEKQKLLEEIKKKEELQKNRKENTREKGLSR